MSEQLTLTEIMDELDQSLETIREWIEAAQIDDDEYEKRSDLVNRMETRFAALRGALP